MALPQEPLPKPPLPRAMERAGGGHRIILIRHGRPRIELKPRTSHREFRNYIDAYEEAGLDPQSAPPAELCDLIRELSEIFTSARPRAHQSAAALAPHAELIVDPLFAEAPLASPKIPLLKMTVQKWAVVARVLWHAGFHPGIENYARSNKRARDAANILMTRARKDGATALVAHGYLNFLIGRELKRRAWRQTGAHRAKYWNAVIYESK
jgi:broad specificity phosphatase PhoE